MYIQSVCSIKKGSVALNKKTLQKTTSPDLNSLLKLHYDNLAIDYPKFFKMDTLSKLAFIGVEFLKPFLNTNTPSEEKAIVLSNASSTIVTDQKHQESIQEENSFFPSPANFVYTLPNISIGEISIRNNIKGENTFFISEQYDIAFMVNYANMLLNSNKAKVLISGWVEFNESNYDCFIYIIGNEKKGLSLEHTVENTSNLYNSIQ